VHNFRHRGQSPGGRSTGTRQSARASSADHAQPRPA
jgi:hypothetical protein